MTVTTLAEVLDEFAVYDSGDIAARLLALPPDQRAALAAALLDVETLAEAFAQEKWAWLGWTDAGHSTTNTLFDVRRMEAFRNAAAAVLAALRSPT